MNRQTVLRRGNQINILLNCFALDCGQMYCSLALSAGVFAVPPGCSRNEELIGLKQSTGLPGPEHGYLMHGICFD